MSQVIVRNPSDNGPYRIYVDNIGTNSLNSATAATPIDGMTIGTISADNATTPKSLLIPISGGSHGAISQIPVTIALSGGGSIVRPVVVRNSAS